MLQLGPGGGAGLPQRALPVCVLWGVRGRGRGREGEGRGREVMGGMHFSDIR